MNRHQFLTHAGLEVQTLEFWIEQQWLVPDQSADEIKFSDTDVARAHLIDSDTVLLSTFETEDGVDCTVPF